MKIALKVVWRFGLEVWMFRRLEVLKFGCLGGLGGWMFGCLKSASFLCFCVFEVLRFCVLEVWKVLRFWRLAG